MGQLYYSPVTVNTGQVPSTQTDFPVLISYTDARFKTIGNGGHVNNSNGYDIRPYSDSALTTALTYELERYNASTGEVIMWVKRSSLADGNVTYLGYGDTSLTTDGSDGANTFSNSFLGVYHLKDGSTLNVNSATGSNNGTNHSVTATNGQIDGAGGFASASSQYIDLGTGIDPFSITLSAWVNGTSFPDANYNAVIVRGATGVNAFLYVKGSGKLACGCVRGVSVQVIYDGTGSHTLSTGTWYYLAMTYSSAPGLIGYVNAASDGTDVGGSNIQTGITANTNIGRDPQGGARFWNGTIDEARVASVARSADWITTEYNNQSAPSTFASLGAEIILGLGGLYRIA